MHLRLRQRGTPRAAAQPLPAATTTRHAADRLQVFALLRRVPRLRRGAPPDSFGMYMEELQAFKRERFEWQVSPRAAVERQWGSCKSGVQALAA
jgi:hypothetical protein